MYRHVYDVATLIYDSYHLLIGTTCWHTHKTGKLAYSVIHMNNVIARFHLLKFLHRECNLTRASLVRPQIVLVETVEYLMVGEETDAQSVVGEALMQGLVHRRERQPAAHALVFRTSAQCLVVSLVIIIAPILAVENVAQPLRLLCTVGQYI